MTSMRILASVMLAAGAHNAFAQSAPTPPAQAPAPALKLPASAPPPPRPAAIVPASQRTPTPPLSLKAAPNDGTVPPSRVHPDSVRAATARTSVATKLAVSPPTAQVANPPRRAAVTSTSLAASATVNSPAARPIGATMRCKDGTYLTGTASADRCAGNGGVAATFPAISTPAQPRPQPQRKQP